jgi:hypothetical protein
MSSGVRAGTACEGLLFEFPKPGPGCEGIDLLESPRDFGRADRVSWVEFSKGQGTTMKRRCARGAVVGETPREADRLPDSVRLPRHGMARLLFSGVSAAAMITLAVTVFADDKKDPTKPVEPETVICLELPHPERVIDRLTDPRIQGYLNLLPQYQKFSSGKQVADLRGVAGVIASQLDTTWEAGLRDLTGGGVLAEVEVSPGQAPRVHVLVTAKKPELLEKASQAFLKLVRQDAQQKGKPDPASESTHRGLTITALGGPQGIAYCIGDGRLLATNSVKNLERLIDRGIEMAARSGKATGPDKADGALAALGASPRWKAIREKQAPDALAWSFVDLERLRKIDPAKFAYANPPDTGIMLFFGSWYEAFRKATAATASIRWSDTDLAASVDFMQPAGGRAPAFKGYLPAPGKGAGPLIRPPGTIGSLSLWRNWSAIWESKADLFRPETVQGFAQLDTFAGQFFGVREFGPDVLGAFEPHWRLVVASQDYQSIKPVPEVKYPGLAFVTELTEPDSDFAQRLKVAFQTFVGLSNVDAVQKKGPPFELVSEQVDGVTLATARYMVPKTDSPAATSPDARYNLSPSAAQVGKYFILSTSAGLARALIKDLRNADAAQKLSGESSETAVLEADGAELARLLELNRARLAMQLMLGRGLTKEKAEAEVAKGLDLLHYLGAGRMTVLDDPDKTSVKLDFKLSK